MIQDKLRNNDYYDVDNQVNKCEDKVNDFRNNYIDNGNKKDNVFGNKFSAFFNKFGTSKYRKLKNSSSSLHNQIINLKIN